jgi:hypothetical protein
LLIGFEGSLALPRLHRRGQAVFDSESGNGKKWQCSATNLTWFRFRLMTGIDPDRFRKHAEECHEQAVRNLIDKEAWLRLAEDLIKIAEGLEKLHRENKTCDPRNNVDEQIGDNNGSDYG